jgi:hypothetical protein
MNTRILIAAALAAGLLVSGCAQQQAEAPDKKATENPEKYARDRSLCLGQVDEYMRSRRRVDDASAGTFADDTDRAGRDGLQKQMANYGDSKNTDRFMASCMEARGWPQPPKSWWQNVGGIRW